MNFLPFPFSLLSCHIALPCCFWIPTSYRTRETWVRTVWGHSPPLIIFKQLQTTSGQSCLFSGSARKTNAQSHFSCIGEVAIYMNVLTHTDTHTISDQCPCFLDTLPVSSPCSLDLRTIYTSLIALPPRKCKRMFAWQWGNRDEPRSKLNRNTA